MHDWHPADRQESAFSPRISVLRAVTDNVRVRGSAYRSFRAPTINELFRPFRVRNDITEANATLEPETLTGAELGLGLRGAKARADFTVFHNRVDDPIANVTLALGPGFILPCGFTPGGGTCRQRQNLDRTRIQGFEGEFRAHPSDNWEIRASALLNDTEIIAAQNNPALEGKQIAQVPETQLVLGLVYSNPKGVNVSIQGRWVGDQFEDDLNTRTLESFTVVDLSLSRQINDRWNVFLRGENVLDEEVEVGLTGDGRVSIGAPFQVHGGFRVRLQR